MAVFYRLSQVTSPKQKGYGKWYPRAVMTNTVDTDALATIMQRNCTVKKSDIVAVITELIETMQDQLQDSKRVKLNGFGSFKIGMSSTGAEKASDFDARKPHQGSARAAHARGEDRLRGSASRRRSSRVAAYREAPKNEVNTSKPKDDSEAGGSDIPPVINEPND